MLAFTDTTKGALPEYTDLVGGGAASSVINYNGSVQMRDTTRTDFDPLLLRGNHRLSNLSIITRNSNYALHSESAGAERDWLQVIEDVVFRHDGNEEAWAWSQANGGAGISVGGKWTPAVGVGMSSGARLEIHRGRATSLKGGGVYVHNSPRAPKPCSLLLNGVTLGSDQPVADDMVLHSLGSGQKDTAEFKGVTFGNGTFSMAVSWLEDDPAKNPASHTEWAVSVSGSTDFVFGCYDPGRALRIRKPRVGQGTIRLGGSAAPVLLGPTVTQVDGDEGLVANAFGYFDIAGGGYTTAGMWISLGHRLGDCSRSPKDLTVAVDGASRVVNFARNYTNVSNDDILAEINAAFGGLAIADEWASGNRFRPDLIDQERRFTNVGSWAINFGTMVVWDDASSTCRSAEPSDFSGGSAAAGLRVGIAWEDIRRGVVGRVQVRGKVSAQALATNAPQPDVGAGFTAGVNSEGVHGTLVYAGASSATLKCVRQYLEDGEGRASPAMLQVG